MEVGREIEDPRRVSCDGDHDDKDGQDHKKTSQGLRMLSMSLSDCQSLTLNVMIRGSQFVKNNQLCHH